MPNRLAQETSPYLLQHANNPVDWFPWGPDALARAKLLDRPIFLSIGYAACHWCHVMERESFELEDTAAILNGRFVSIKVDREERPDLDSIYMSAVQAMTGSGGWPMSVFLTPDGAPFYGGTYFPDQPRHGMPSFHQVLEGVWRAWTTQRSEVLAAGQRMVDALVQQSQPVAGTGGGPGGPGGGPGEASGLGGPGGLAGAASGGPLAGVDGALFAAVDAGLAERFDQREGSWGGAPKFPQPMTIEYLLRRIAAGGMAGDSPDPRLTAMARFTLDRMADGGIRDQLGGGFHRYATDAHWLVPHFEQMLYDNAQLARAYVHASVAFDEPWYREVAVGVLEYMLRELRTADGAFAASQDADTEGEEGLTFTWHAPEIREVLGDDAPALTAAYGVTDDGNWEGSTILSRVTERGPAGSEAEARLDEARARLLARRATRTQPARDDKALAAWNGLAIAAFADAGRLLGERRYTDAAAAAANAIVGGLLAEDGSLRRSWKDGRAVGQGVLEDYSHLAEGLLALYAATFEERWFVLAQGLIDRVLARFSDPAGGFFDTADDHERLITRPRDVQDNATPSGSAMATTVLLRLAALTGEGRYRDAAERALGTVRPYLDRYPTGFAQWLVAASIATSDVLEVAIVGDPADGATQALLAVTADGWRPNVVVALAPDDAAAADSAIPLLHDRVAIGGQPTAYVCRGFVCDLPVTDPEALRARLGR